MPLRRRSVGPASEDVALLARRLLTLDPWSFWTVELGAGEGASFVVLGTTGGFVVEACGLSGYLVAEGRQLTVDGRRVEGGRELRGAAKRVRGRLVSAGAATHEVVPLLVLTRAVAGAPRSHAGVRVVRPEDVVSEITDRTRVLDPSTAERLARRLGRVLRGPGEAAHD